MNKFVLCALKICADFLPCAEIYLFGSFANGTFTRSSDIDIAIDGAREEQIRQLRCILESSTIPRKVDIVDLNFCGEKLREIIFREGIKWQT